MGALHYTLREGYIQMATKKTQGQTLTIAAPNMPTATFLIRGTAPYIQNKFSQKAIGIIKETQLAGSTAKKGKKREPKDFQSCYEGAMHKSEDGWHGIPASAFRNALVSACRVAGFQMTRAKLTVFIEADGFDPADMTPLVRITKGEPQYFESYVRLDQGGADLRARPMWAPGWEALVRVKFDADMFKLEDVANLLMRVGMQVGIGEGRPDSPKSTGQGWGLFDLIGHEMEGK